MRLPFISDYRFLRACNIKSRTCNIKPWTCNITWYIFESELGIFGLKLATLEPELAILLGIFESELGIFRLKLTTLEPELAILLDIFEPEHVILESELATLLNRSLQYPSIFSSMVLF